MRIERAALSARPEDVIAKLDHAPPWVRSRFTNGGDAKGKSSPTPTARRSAPRRFVGWVTGVAVCGISKPAYSKLDGQSLCEQFTPAGLKRMVDEAHRSATPVELQWGHDGPALASTAGIDLTFKLDERYGLLFDARLPESPLAEEVMGLLERGLLGVSVAYTYAKQWHVERSGVGFVRVVDSAKLAHVALLKRGGMLSPAYPACWATGQRGSQPGPSLEMQNRVRWRALDELRIQAGRDA